MVEIIKKMKKFSFCEKLTIVGIERQSSTQRNHFGASLRHRLAH